MYVQQEIKKKRMCLIPSSSSSDQSDNCEAKKRKGVNDEPAPRLLSPITILLGNSGYIQIGYLPELQEDESVIFHVRTVIALGESYIPFDIEELANFFINIRQHQEFAHFDGGEIYFPHISDEFLGNFFINSSDTSYGITYINYQNDTIYELISPNKDMIIHILSLEKIISGHMNNLCVLENEKEALFIKLEEVRVRCVGTAMHIKSIAENTEDKFVVEMATNLFSFFVKYWETKNK